MRKAVMKKVQYVVYILTPVNNRYETFDQQGFESFAAAVAFRDRWRGRGFTTKIETINP